MKKEYVYIKIALHPIQVRLIEAFKKKSIDIGYDTLRGICKKIGIESSPQKVKHHLQQLVKLGILDVVGGLYVINTKNIRK